MTTKVGTKTESSFVADLNFWAKEIGDYTSSKDGARSTVQVAKAAFDWHNLVWTAPEGNQFSQRARGELDILDMAFAVPEFLCSIIGFKDRWNAFWHKDDEIETQKLASAAAEVACSGSESLLFLEGTGLLSLKETLRSVQGVFWGSLLCFEGLEYLSLGRDEKVLAKVRAMPISLEVRQYCAAKGRLGYIALVRIVSLVALSALALIALVFPHLAHGFLFSPVTALALTTICLAGKILGHFYKKCLDLRAKDLEATHKNPVDIKAMKLLKKI